MAAKAVVASIGVRATTFAFATFDIDVWGADDSEEQRNLVNGVVGDIVGARATVSEQSR